MQARNSPHSPARGKPTRHERRLAKREAQKAQRFTPQRELRVQPAALLILGAVIIIAFGVLGYVRTRPVSAPAATAEPALVSSAAFDPLQSHLKVGSVAPSFTLMDRYNVASSLSVERGHPVLIEFFASWCPVCHHETKVMNQIMSTYQPRGVRVWAVLANPYGPDYEQSRGTDVSLVTRSDLNWYQQTYKAHYPLLIDPRFETVNRYGVGAYPTLYLINAKGSVAYVNSGAIPFKTLSAQIEKAMQGATT